MSSLWSIEILRVQKVIEKEEGRQGQEGGTSNGERTIVRNPIYPLQTVVNK